jgi:hypothetical protein
MITRLTVRRRLPGGFALVWMLSVFMVIFFEVSDGRISQWMFEVELFLLEENRAESEPALAADRGVLIEQRDSQDISEGSREIDSTDAYLEQFEQPGGTQWLPHSY